jgi:hypothetical protein
MASTGETAALTRNGNLYVGPDGVMLAGLVGAGWGRMVEKSGKSKEVTGLSWRCGRRCGTAYRLREEDVGEDVGKMRRVVGKRLSWLLDERRRCRGREGLFSAEHHHMAPTSKQIPSKHGDVPPYI